MRLARIIGLIAQSPKRALASASATIRRLKRIIDEVKQQIADAERREALR
jgi:hypothetical protein